jgi:2-polyprenyl-3-methyl-5-hydroxy-6-metoxy-1,4-benzoquinol methylase
MNPDQIQIQKQLISDRYGAWTNHNIQLAPNLYTISAEPTGADPKLRRYVQIIADLVLGTGNDGTKRSWQDLRILDLACLEGIYGIEMALQGAEVVGIEGREANIAKARFVKEVLKLENIQFYQDDVRNLSFEKYGKFDVVICVGILYHLDVPDIFQFLTQIHSVCNHLAIIDTQLATHPETKVSYQGQDYWGKTFIEHEPNLTTEQKLNKLWASLDNSQSFWLTRASFHNFLEQLGFSSIYECHHPAVKRYEVMRTNENQDRATFVAIAGKPSAIKSNDLAESQNSWQEIEQLKLNS